MARVPLGQALIDLGRVSEAVDLLRPVTGRLVTDPGPEHPLTLRARAQLDRPEGADRR